MECAFVVITQCPNKSLTTNYNDRFVRSSRTRILAQSNHKKSKDDTQTSIEHKHNDESRYHTRNAIPIKLNTRNTESTEPTIVLFPMLTAAFWRIVAFPISRINFGFHFCCLPKNIDAAMVFDLFCVRYGTHNHLTAAILCFFFSSLPTKEFLCEWLFVFFIFRTHDTNKYSMADIRWQ